MQLLNSIAARSGLDGKTGLGEMTNEERDDFRLVRQRENRDARTVVPR